MGKRIIFCSDGTWDTAQSATNVYKLFKSILPLEDQLAFYDEGVGSDGTSFDKFVGGAFGNGLFQRTSKMAMVKLRRYTNLVMIFFCLALVVEHTPRGV